MTVNHLLKSLDCDSPILNITCSTFSSMWLAFPVLLFVGVFLNRLQFWYYWETPCIHNPRCAPCPPLSPRVPNSEQDSELEKLRHKIIYVTLMTQSFATVVVVCFDKKKNKIYAKKTNTQQLCDQRSLLIQYAVVT